MGILNLKWHDAMRVAGHAFTRDEQNAGWPARMTAAQLAALQRPRYFTPVMRMMEPDPHDPVAAAQIEQNAANRALLKALQSEFEAGHGPDTAPRFKAWLEANGEQPSKHIAAWFEAVGQGQDEAPAVGESSQESTEQRQARRYQACIDAGLVMPSDDYSHLPRGIGKVAKDEGITRPAFAEDVKAHIRRLNGR